jgi:putative endonuclease
VPRFLTSTAWTLNPGSAHASIAAMGKVFIVYMMANRRDGPLYTGVTANPAGRMWQHKTKQHGESFTSRYNIHRLVWYEVHDNAEAAILREKRIKDWQRAWKDRLVDEMNPTWRDLAPDIEQWF